MNQKVNFIVIGFMKCGTTSLIKNLALHPEIDVPKSLMNINKKAAHEAKYFNKHCKNKSIEWYESFFKDNLVSGEKTPNYVIKHSAMWKIYKYNPNIKLIVNVRNPINRYISHCKMKFDRKNKGKLNNQFIRQKFNKGHFLTEGLYFDRIQTNVLKFFDRSQLYINVVDEIDDNIRDEYTSGYDKEKYGLNRAYRFQSQDQKTEQKILDIFNFLNVSQDVNLDYHLDYVSNYSNFKLDKDLNNKLKQYYKKDIVELASLIDRPDIKKWVK